MGRTEKYAKVLEEENNKKTTKKVSKKEPVIDKDKEYEDTAPISLEEYENTKNLKVVKPKKKKVSKPKNTEEIEKAVKKINDEDIYLTSSFKPLKKKLRLKKFVKFIIILLLLTGIGFAFYFFVVKPAIKFYKNIQPVQVYYNSIDYVSDHMIDLLESEDEHTGRIYGDFDVSLRSNMDDYKDISNTSLGYILGLDSNEDKIEEMAYVKSGNMVLGKSIYIIGDKTYNKFSNNDKVYDVTSITTYDKKEDKDYYLFKDAMNLVKTNRKDYIAIIDETRNIYKSLITKDMVKAKMDTIEVNGKSIKVIKNTISFDSNSLKEFNEKFVNKAIENDRFIEAYGRINGMTKEEAKKHYLDSLKNKKYDEKVIYNIYTVKGTKFAGFDVEKGGFRDFYFYLDGKNFEGHINGLAINICKDKKEDCVSNTQLVYDFIGTSKEDYVEVNVKKNKKDFGVFKVKKLEKDLIEFDYEVGDKNKLNGDFYLMKSNQSYHFDFTLKDGSEYLNVNVNYNYSLSKDVASFDTDNVVQYNKKEWKNAGNSLTKDLKDNNLTKEYETWLDRVNNILNDISDKLDLLNII